jgi:hypothetical protein
VDDLVGGLVAMLDSSHTGPFNLGNPTELTMMELAHLVVELTGASVEIVHRPLPEDDPTRRRPDVTRAREALGWRPTISPREGLQRTIEWFKTHVETAAELRVQRPKSGDKRRVLDDATCCMDAVPPADLLSLCIRTSGVRDADLEEAPVSAGHLGRDFGLETEAIFFDLDGLEHLSIERLVAGFHVGEVQIREHVRHRREETVAHVVPVVQDTVRTIRTEPASIDDIGSAVEQRGQQLAVFCRVVLEVGVLHHHEISSRLGEASPEGSAFAHVSRLLDDANSRIEDLASALDRAVSRPVVDDNHLGCVRGIKHSLDDGGNTGFFVVTGDND